MELRYSCGWIAVVIQATMYEISSSCWLAIVIYHDALAVAEIVIQ